MNCSKPGTPFAGGYVTPDRTTTITSTSRSYLVVEKMAMSEGRYDPQRLIDAVEKNSRATLLLDLEAIAREAGAMINAVMLGAMAGACCRSRLRRSNGRSAPTARRSTPISAAFAPASMRPTPVRSYRVRRRSARTRRRPRSLILSARSRPCRLWRKPS